MDKEIEEFCKRAVEEWGEESQLRMCIEEMSELTKEICKYIRIMHSDDFENLKEKWEQTRNNIIEETADVLICAGQLALMYGEDKVKKVEYEKVKRASKLFKNNNAEGETDAK